MGLLPAYSEDLSQRRGSSQVKIAKDFGSDAKWKCMVVTSLTLSLVALLNSYYNQEASMLEDIKRSLARRNGDMRDQQAMYGKYDSTIDLGDSGTPSYFYMVRGLHVHTLQIQPEAGFADVTVVLLHGSRYSAHSWRDLGTLKLLTNQTRSRVVAVDLPGHGSTKGSLTNVPEERAAFLEDLLAELNTSSSKLVLVTPAMSGLYAFPFLARHADNLTAWVGIAPIGLMDWEEPQDTTQEAALNKLDMTVVYGDLDPMKQEAAAVKNIFPDAEELVIEDAGANPLFDATDEINNLLLAAIRRATKKPAPAVDVSHRLHY